jgi:hypothetical protein
VIGLITAGCVTVALVMEQMSKKHGQQNRTRLMQKSQLWDVLHARKSFVKMLV